jgi:tRNA (guanine37-N1)-methyltransferase
MSEDQSEDQVEVIAALEVSEEGAAPTGELPAPFVVQILTLFPEFFESPLSTSIIGRAVESGAARIGCTQIRDFATDKHRTTDDVPYGGGAGMVMKPEPTVAALEHAREQCPGVPRVYLTPDGERFSQAIAQEMASWPGMVLVCGRYEGLDERVREGWIDREISIGDYVLTGGEPAALILIDAVVRLIPGVLGNPGSLSEESFSNGRLEYPHYTRPREFRGRSVPEVLLNGNHAKIDAWRREQSEQRTRARRPDLFGLPAKDEEQDA